MKCICPAGGVRRRHHRRHGEVRRRQHQQRRRLLVDVHDRARLRLPAGQGAVRSRLRRRHPHRQRAVRSGDRRREERVLEHLPLESGLRVHGQPGQRVPHDQVRRRQEGRRRGLRRRQHGAVRRLLRDLQCPSRHAHRAARPAPARGKCGDGILLSGEACDDGNNLSGDGCSADCKTVESGFMCTRPPLGDSIDVPAVYRDFSYHTPNPTSSRAATGRDGDHPGLVDTMLDADRKARAGEYGDRQRRTSPARRRSPVVHGTTARSTRPRADDEAVPSDASWRLRQPLGAG